MKPKSENAQTAAGAPTLWPMGSTWTPVLCSLLLVGLSAAWLWGGEASLGSVLTWAAFLLIGSLLVGELIWAAVLDPDYRAQNTTNFATVSRNGRRAMLTASGLALALAVTSMCAALVQLATALEVPLSEAAGYFAGNAWQPMGSKTFVISAALALVVSVLCLVTSSLSAAMWAVLLTLVAIAVPGISSHSAGLGDHGLAMTSTGLLLAAASAMAGSVGSISRRGFNSVSIARFHLLQLWLALAMACAAVATVYTRVDSWSDLVASRMWIAGSLIALGLILLALWPARTANGTIVWAGALTLLGSLGVVLLPPSRAGLALSTPAEQILGRPMPPAPSWSYVFGWQPDYLWVLIAAVSIGLYASGYARLRRRGDRWPLVRLVCWILGWFVVLWATSSGLAVYSMVSVGWHMVQHMTLVMCAPILLVLGAPVSLAMRSVRPSPTRARGPREVLVSVMNSRAMHWLASPLWIVIISVVAVFGLYFTSVFAGLMGNHLGHVLMTAHFLLLGYLVAWVAVGLDPHPGEVPHWARIIVVLVTIVWHSFFAISLMASKEPIGSPWYDLVAPPWLGGGVGGFPARVADTEFAGEVAWGLGEIPTAILLVIIAVQWSRSDDREARRKDRQALRDDDAELRAYNDYLASLNRRASRD